MERAGLTGCVPKNGKSWSDRLCAKEWKEPIWQVVCQRMERAGLARCVPKNGKSRFGKLFDKEMKLRYSDIYMKRSFSLCMEITGLPCFLAVLAQSDE